MSKPATPKQSEASFQRQVIQYARLMGFKVAHFRPGRTANGNWRTPVQADGAGFPDLVCVRERVVFIELKRDGGRVRPQQTAWLEALAAAGAEAYLWAPSQWAEIERVLGRKP